MKLLMLVGLVALALTACSGDTGVTEVASVAPPADTPMPVPTLAAQNLSAGEVSSRASTLPPKPDGVASAQEPDLQESNIDEIDLTTDEKQRIIESYLPDFPISLTEFGDFPDDISLIYREGYACYEGCYTMPTLYRAYKRDGELVREELFPEEHPIFLSLEPPSYKPSTLRMYPNLEGSVRDDQFEFISTDDGSRMVMLLCHRTSCFQSGIGGNHNYDPDSLPLPTTVLYESTDGGVTWHHLDTLELPWYPEAITAGSVEREPQLLLSSSTPVVPVWGAHMLWPSRVMKEWPEGMVSAEIVMLELLEMMDDPHLRSARPELPGVLPIVLKGEVASRPTVHPLAIRQGPFLRVVDVGEGCLPIVAEARPDAEELACVAERVLLQDQDLGGDVITDDGVTWRRARTPAGVEGWADGNYLER